MKFEVAITSPYFGRPISFSYNEDGTLREVIYEKGLTVRKQ